MNWKSLPKIDAHVHILPREVLDANPDSDDEFSRARMEEHLRLMERYNIRQSLIMTFNDPFLMSMGFTVRDVHRNLREMCTEHAGRYAAFADIDVRNSAEKSVSEIAAALESPVFKGVKVHATNTGIPIDDEYYDAIYVYCEKRDIPVAFHCYPGSDKADVCAPGRIRSVLQRHPDLQVIVCHLGGPQWEDAVDLPAMFDISAVLPDYVEQYGINKTNKILRAFGTDRLFFATDWPCSRSIQTNDFAEDRLYSRSIQTNDFAEDRLYSRSIQTNDFAEDSLCGRVDESATDTPCGRADAIYERYFDVLDQMDFTEEEARDIAENNVRRFLGWPACSQNNC